MQRTVQAGDCVLSIAAEAGVSWESVWNHPNNAALRAERKHPTILMPGDVVTVPDLERGEVGGGSEARHTFRKVGTPARLRLRLRSRGEALGAREFTLTVDGVATTGTTDGEGNLEVAIAPNAREGRLRIAGDSGEYKLLLGWLTPVDETSGLQARLINLGYDPKGIDNDFGGNTRKAMQQFQRDCDMKTTRQPDAATRDRLAAEHGS